jgi:hypothetical protein
MTERPQRDAGVLWLVWMLGWVQAFLNGVIYAPSQWWASDGRRDNWYWLAKEASYGGPPRVVRIASKVIPPLRHSWLEPRTLWMHFNYSYALWWLILTLAGYVAIGFSHARWLSVLVVVIASWRLTEVLVWQMKMLLDRTHRLILSAERNLTFLFVDAVVAITAIAAMLRQAHPGDASRPDAFSTWVDSLSVVTLNGRPFAYQGVWANLATLVGTFAGLLFIGAGLAVLVGLIQKKFTLGGDEYTGPTRIETPYRDGPLPRRPPA